MLAASYPTRASAQQDRQPSQPAVRAARTGGFTLERGNKTLSAARLRQQTMPSLDNARALAQEYVAAGVLDAAFDHFRAALLFDPHDVPSLDGLARIWRDWGYLQTALPLAYQAVYWAPESAAAQNTLGTLLLRLGVTDAAGTRFEIARALEPSASYPLNNLCFLELQRGNPEAAVALCRGAAARDAASAQARNNLALSLATSGDLDAAFVALETGTSPAVAAYNQGIVLLAARQFERAGEAFGRARTADPAFGPALTRLQQLARREER